MTKDEFNKILDDLQLLKYAVNHALLLCDFIKKELEESNKSGTSAIDDWAAMCSSSFKERKNRKDKTMTTGRDNFTTTYTGDNYD